MPAQSPLAEALADPSRPVYVLASWGQRFRALTFDSLIIFIPVLALWALVLPPIFDRAARDNGLLDEFDAIADGGDPSLDRFGHWTLVVTLAALACYWLVLAIYSGMFMSRTAGQTPGRRVARIRVMRTDGKPITFWWAVYRTVLVREILFTILSFLTLGLAWFAQYFWPLWDPKRRAGHDFVARSRVVQDADRRS